MCPMRAPREGFHRRHAPGDPPQLVFTCPPPEACSPPARGREWEGRLSPTSCFLRPGTTPHRRTPVLFSPPFSNLSLSCRRNTGCAMGPTGNVYPRQPRSPRRKLSRWAQAWGRGTVCRLLDEWAPQPVRPHLHPSLPKGGGQSAPWPPPHPLFLSSPCTPLRPWLDGGGPRE